MGEFSEGVKPLAAALIGTMCGAMTLTTYSQGFFLEPVTTEFGWSNPEFFLGFTIMSLAGLFAAPLVGSLAQKFGIRALGMIGLIGHAIGYVLLSLNPNSLPIWYISWLLISFLAAGSLPIIWTSVLNGWFVKNRGKAVGITMAGTGIGAFILPPIVEFLIANYGWRVAYRSIAIGATALALPFIYFWFHEKKGDFASEEVEDVHSWGPSRKKAIKTIKFWTLGAVLFLTVFVVVGLLSNFEQIMSAKGVERNMVAIYAAIIGVTVIAARVCVGALVDRFWAPAIAAICFSIPIVGILLLIHAPITLPIGILIAFSIGWASGAELDLLAYLTSKYFGPKNYTEIFGGIFALFAIGAGIAPPLFGVMAEKTDSYSAPLYLAIACLVIAIALYLTLGRYPDEALAELD